ncbi:structural cement protein Gp24 [Levilactobacillus brevis]|uniref:structural cement protein Gp24 n=1 Tax=Levilactobacillus brevis TaxID=1580 RepID=UPI000A26F461|nr:hypothetical protein [Levilactobacillus brevis]
MGKIADIRHTEVDSAVAAGVVAAGRRSNEFGAVTTVSDGKFYGVAVAKDYVDNLDDSPQTSKYKAKQMVPVLRKGPSTLPSRPMLRKANQLLLTERLGTSSRPQMLTRLWGRLRRQVSLLPTTHCGLNAQLQINLHKEATVDATRISDD